MQVPQAPERNPELKEAESFIMDSKHACSFLQKEALPSIFQGYLLYNNILYLQSIQNKGGECLCLQDIQKHDRPGGNCLSPDIRQSMPSASQIQETLNIVDVPLTGEKRVLGTVKSEKAAGL